MTFIPTLIRTMNDEIKIIEMSTKAQRIAPRLHTLNMLTAKKSIIYFIIFSFLLIVIEIVFPISFYLLNIKNFPILFIRNPMTTNPTA